MQYWQPFTWAAPALCSPFLLGALWDAEHKIVLGHILRPFWTSIVRPRQYLSSAQALGLNIKWAGIINSLTPQKVKKIILSKALFWIKKGVELSIYNGPSKPIIFYMTTRLITQIFFFERNLIFIFKWSLLFP